MPRVRAQFVAAGADVLTTNSFVVTPFALARGRAPWDPPSASEAPRPEELAELLHAAARCANEAAATATGASSGSSGLGIGGFNPLATLEGNPYFSAGFGLAIMGTGLALLRGAGKTAVTMAKRHLLITLEVTSKDRAYPWVLQWLTEQAQHTSLGQHLSVQTVVKKLANGRTTTLFEFLPSTGTHIVQYNGRLVMIDRVREQQTVDLQTGQPWEAVKPKPTPKPEPVPKPKP